MIYYNLKVMKNAFNKQDINFKRYFMI